MEDLWRSYPFPLEQSLSSHVAECLPHYQIPEPIKSIKYAEPGTCTDVDCIASIESSVFARESPHDYGLFGTASSGPVVQLHQTAYHDSSPAITQCWQKFVANVDDQAEKLSCNSQANSLLNSRDPLLQPTRNHRWKEAAGGGGHDHVVGIVCTKNGHHHKLVERQRRNTMKALCSKLASLLPEEYHKKKHALPDQLLEVIKYIHHLQKTLIELEKKKSELSLSRTVKTFSNASGVYKDLQASQARPSNVPETFPTVRVSIFGLGIQVTANAFKNQIELSSLLMVLEEAGVEVVSATVSAINDRVFFSVHSKLLEFVHFDSAVLRWRIYQLIEGSLPSNSLMK